MDNYIKIEIEVASLETAEILMAELSDINFYAFEQESSLIESWTFKKLNRNALIAYIAQVNFDEKKLKKILSDRHYTKTIIKNRNWNEEWESELQPVYVNHFVGIRASFHQPLQNVNHEIIITPKMSFGTGHHATTYLMIEQMGKINFQNKTILDFGTGTGVLAILAEKLGALKVMAIDKDQWSINNVKENIKANNCRRITIQKKHTLENIEPVDIVLANINLNVLTGNANDISRLMTKGGMLLMSGFLSEDENAIFACFETLGFTKKEVVKRNEWKSISLIKKQ
ncbi:MAG: 50S ribosomal protein L11 methyltransferase [Bacteroidota bacterium]|nr:50S ribosomal protein L11 methyltransferase [Bacteroidota bacterium]